MQEWEKRLGHARAVRDSHVAAGAPAPDREDPPGCVIHAGRAKVFDGPNYWAKMEELGHDNSEFERCSCRDG